MVRAAPRLPVSNGKIFIEGYKLKKIIFIIIAIFSSALPLHALDLMGGYGMSQIPFEFQKGPAVIPRVLLGHITFSSSYGLFEEKHILNYSIGQQLMFLQELGEHRNYYYTGLNYKWGASGRGVSLHGIFVPIEFSWQSADMLEPTVNIGAGTTLLYNISRKYYGVGPQVDLIFGGEHAVEVNFTYRYNINFGAANSQEIGLRISVVDYINFNFDCCKK